MPKIRRTRRGEKFFVPVRFYDDFVARRLESHECESLGTAPRQFHFLHLVASLATTPTDRPISAAQVHCSLDSPAQTVSTQ